MKVPLLLLIAFSICANSSSHQRNLKIPPHPRLILNGDDIARIWTNIKKYPLATTLFERLKNHSESLMQGGDIRDTSYSLGLMYRLTNDTRYARAGIQNLLKLAANKDACQGCNGDCSKLETGCPGPMCGQSVAPRSASLCFGVTGDGYALGFDWFYQAMTPAERNTTKRFLTTQILNVYGQGLSRAFTADSWFRSRDNFNSVINSGALMTALALLDEPDGESYGNPGQFARDAFQVSLLGLSEGAKSIYADGSYPEGPGYGDFAVSHYLTAVRALESCFGESFGLDVPGLSQVVDPVTSPCFPPLPGCFFPPWYRWPSFVPRSQVARYYVDLGSSGFSGSNQTFNWADGGTGKAPT